MFVYTISRFSLRNGFCLKCGLSKGAEAWSAELGEWRVIGMSERESGA